MDFSFYSRIDQTLQTLKYIITVVWSGQGGWETMDLGFLLIFRAVAILLDTNFQNFVFCSFYNIWLFNFSFLSFESK